MIMKFILKKEFRMKKITEYYKIMLPFLVLVGAFILLSGSGELQAVSINPAIEIDPLPLEAMEGDSLSYMVSLATMPSADVIVEIMGDSQVDTLSVRSLRFTPSDYGDKSVTVRITDDDIAEGVHTGVLTHSASSDDLDYNNLPPRRENVTITDNDIASVIISIESLTVAEGSESTYTAVLASQPLSNVTVEVNAGDGLTATPRTLAFTSGNWDTPKTVTVSAESNTTCGDERESQITHDVIGFGGATAQPIDVTIEDTTSPCPVYLPLIIQKEYIRYLGFESSLVGWTIPSDPIAASLADFIDTDGNLGSDSQAVSDLLSGSEALLIGDPSYDNLGGVPVGFGTVSRQIDVPVIAKKLKFDYVIVSHDIGWNSSSLFDTFELHFSDPFVGNALPGTAEDVCRNSGGTADMTKNAGVVFCDGITGSASQDGQPQMKTGSAEYDFGNAPGLGDGEMIRTITLTFRVHNRGDGFYNTWVYIDNVRFEE